MNWPRLEWRLPAYLDEALPEDGERFADDTARMDLAIRLSRCNIEHGGGPFGACVFERDSGRLLAPGVNLVVPMGCSIAHAEMVAIAMAQQVAGVFNLAEAGAFELVTSAEPCAQCFGAIPWSGVRRVVYGAGRTDVEAVGFDEGPKPRSWKAALRARGIEVAGPVRREAAAKVLRAYRDAGAPIYNGGKPATS